jgi:hypothetical protein
MSENPKIKEAIEQLIKDDPLLQELLAKVAPEEREVVEKEVLGLANWLGTTLLDAYELSEKTTEK